jgi:hypothetical protein
MCTIIADVFLVAIVLYIRNVGVDKERVLAESAVEEELFLFLEVDWFELFEACGEVCFFLVFALPLFFGFCLLFLLCFLFPLLLILRLSLYLLFDYAKVPHFFLAALAVDDWTRGVERVFR